MSRRHMASRSAYEPIEQQDDVPTSLSSSTGSAAPIVSTSIWERLIPGYFIWKYAVTGSDPASRCNALAARLRSEHGAEFPGLMAMSFAEALHTSTRDNRPLLVYLHCDYNQDTPAVCREVFGNSRVRECITENCRLWIGCVHEADGWEIAKKCEATSFPFFAIYHSSSNVPSRISSPSGGSGGASASRAQYSRLWYNAGYISSSQFIHAIDVVLGRHREARDREAAERASREYERQLRAEQDREYAQLEAQMRREAEEKTAAERRRQEEAKVKAAAEEHAKWEAADAAELEAAVELSKRLAVESDMQVARRRLEAHPPPPDGVTAGVARIRFTLPHGVRVERRFTEDTTFQTVYDYIYVTANDLGAPLNSGFEVATTLPRRVFSDPSITLKAAGLVPQGVLMVSAK